MTFAQIVGHERVVERLRGAICTGRPAHAYLLTGPAGIGKRTLGAAFTAALVCEAPVDGDACERCESCRRTAAGMHADVHVVRREEGRRDVRTEQAREMTRWLALRPLTAARKVAVVEDAECLNEHGQNALLKTLEEPPGAAVLVVLATEASLLLPTVRSRCQRLRLDPLPAALVAQVLAARGIAAERAAPAVARAGGSPGRALELVDDPRAASRQRMLAQLAALSAASAADLSGTAQALGRDDVDVALGVTVTWYRDLLALALEGDAPVLRNVDAESALHAARARLAVTGILRALEIACDTIRAVERNANRVLALETMLLALRRIEGAASA